MELLIRMLFIFKIPLKYISKFNFKKQVQLASY